MTFSVVTFVVYTIDMLIFNTVCLISLNDYGCLSNVRSFVVGRNDLAIESDVAHIRDKCSVRITL